MLTIKATEMRATGQTTRLIDAAVQTLFTTGEVEIVSEMGSPDPRHHEKDDSLRIKMNENMWHRLMRRLNLEHQSIRTSTTKSNNKIIVKIIK